MNRRNKTLYVVWIFVLFFSFGAIAPGCSQPPPDPDSIDPANVSDQAGDTIQEEIIEKVSQRVLGDIPVTGILKDIKERGVLRAALPAPDPGFQDFDPVFAIPSGFNPSLINEMATILGGKSNIVLLENNEGNFSLPDKWEEEFDIVAIPENSDGVECPAENSIKYFFTREINGDFREVKDWKIFCTAGGGELALAVSEILSYLNETGIYARYYEKYVAGK